MKTMLELEVFIPFWQLGVYMFIGIASPSLQRGWKYHLPLAEIYLEHYIVEKQRKQQNLANFKACSDAAVSYLNKEGPQNCPTYSIR